MKKKILLLLPALLMTLAACNNNNKGGGGGSGGHESGELPEDKEVTIYCYLDYNHADEENPYLKAEWYEGVPFSKEDIGLTDPTNEQASYLEFAHFKGWSIHPIIDDLEDLWDFENDYKEKDERGYVLQLYGIWLEE